MMDFRFAGQRITESTGTRSKTLAKEIEKKRRRDLEEGATGIGKRRRPLLLSVAAEERVALRRSTIRGSTADFYACALSHLLSALGRRLLQDIDSADIARYQRQRQKEPIAQTKPNNGAAGEGGEKKPKLTAARTINDEVGVLRQIMRRNRLWGNIQPDVRMLPGPSSPGVAITRGQEAKLLECCLKSQSRSLYPFVVLAAETGARYKVIRTLQWKRVDFVGRCLQWEKTKHPRARAALFR